MIEYSNSRVIELINEYVHLARDRDILIDRFVDGLTFAELSDKYFLSERHIKRIVKKFDPVLIKHL